MRTFFFWALVFNVGISAANADLIKCEIKPGDQYLESVNGEVVHIPFSEEDFAYTVYRVDEINGVDVVDASEDLELEQEINEKINWTFSDGIYFGTGLIDVEGDTAAVSGFVSENLSALTLNMNVEGAPILIHVESGCSLLDQN